jgi:hypothetical protein
MPDRSSDRLEVHSGCLDRRVPESARELTIGSEAADRFDCRTSRPWSDELAAEELGGSGEDDRNCRDVRCLRREPAPRVGAHSVDALHLRERVSEVGGNGTGARSGFGAAPLQLDREEQICEFAARVGAPLVVRLLVASEIDDVRGAVTMRVAGTVDRGAGWSSKPSGDRANRLDRIPALLTRSASGSSMARNLMAKS